MNTRVSSITHLPFTEEVQQQLQQHEDDIVSFRASLVPLQSSYPSSRILSEALLDARCAYRWLKARSFSIKAATEMMKEACEYRQEYKLDSILTSPLSICIDIRRLSRDGWHGFDQHGSPIFIQRFGQLDLKQLQQIANHNDRLFYHHYLSEYVQCVLLPLASNQCGHHVDTITSIFDMSGLSMKLINTYNAQFVRASIRIAALIYPESMRVSMIINTPRIFSVAWNMVKGFIDEATRNKISITRNPSDNEWETYGIDRETLPLSIGGTCICGEKDDIDGWNGCISCHPLAKQFESFIQQHVQTTLDTHVHEKSLDDNVSEGIDGIAAETDSDDSSDGSPRRLSNSSSNSDDEQSAITYHHHQHQATSSSLFHPTQIIPSHA